ncbi:hypothetical protein HU200_042407 [Digitaria exilis]|uniref:Uncharacterized protein n=1 Tax=Digitaria exilis TaxID=1010633 RepID=A0A835BAW3_9POAL|nr:hypothetical protein HU200_042407 [Digitaria exilis]
MHNLGDAVGVTARTFPAVPIAYRPGYVGSPTRSEAAMALNPDFVLNHVY